MADELSMQQACEATGLSADTLRYYEKIGLLTRVPRSPGGARRYDRKTLEQIRFIQRAKAMRFSLEEIRDLLRFRESPQTSREEVRALARQKQALIREQIAQMAHLEKELQLLLNLCRQSTCGCPILEGLDEHPESRGD